MWSEAEIAAARTTSTTDTRTVERLIAAPRAAKPLDLDDYVLDAIIREVRARGGDWEDTPTNTTRTIQAAVPSFIRPALTLHSTAWAINRLKPQLANARILLKRGRQPDHQSRARFVRFSGDKPESGRGQPLTAVA